jgi:DNA-binding PadR family transcriptional regulator
MPERQHMTPLDIQTKQVVNLIRHGEPVGITELIELHDGRRPVVYRLTDSQKEAVARLAQSIAAEVGERPFEATRPDPQRGIQLGETIAEIVADTYLEAANAWEVERSQRRKMDALTVHREVGQ